MDIFFPTYFKRFQCIASACPDSCCKEWTVDVDAKSAQYYRALSGALGDRLRQVLQDTEDGTIMTITNGRCPMWQQNGLCRIQAELGHDALCQTCRDFPRIRHDYGDFMELGLELSCPEAARLILTCEDWELEIEQQPGGESPDYDTAVMEILRRSRREILAFLKNSPYSLPETLAVILLYSHHVQGEIDGGQPAVLQPNQLLAQAKSLPKNKNLATLFAFFSRLEILTPQWKILLTQCPQNIVWSPSLKYLTRYLIQRYWLQAISDYDLICRTKLIVSACILVCALGGKLLQAAQLFSKEIENDPDNIEAILNGAYSASALTDVNLFGILLS